MLQPMNKRGAVGVRDGEFWRASYNFADSTPTVFGPEVWARLQENWQSLTSWGKDLLQYGYWDEYINDGYCPYCGKFDIGQPYNIQMSQLKAIENGILAPDPQSKRHCHKPKAGPISSLNEAIEGLWVEWLYIVNPKDYMLEVIRSVRDKGSFTARKGERKWEQPFYRYHSIGLYSLFNDEPDWERIQHLGLASSAYYYEKFNDETQSSKKSFL